MATPPKPAPPPPPGRAAPKRVKGKQFARVQEVLDFVGREIAYLPFDTLRDLVPVLAAAQHELERDLAKWLAKMPDGAERFTAQKMRAALLQIKTGLAAIEEIHPEMYRMLMAGGKTASLMAMRHLEIETARFSEIFGQPIRMQIRQAAVLARGEDLLVPRYESSAARYSQAMQDDIRHELAVGVAKGETHHQLVTRLQQLGGPKGLVAMRGVLGSPGAIAANIAEGLFRKYRYWAERIVRTELMHTYNVVHQQSLEQLAAIDQTYVKRWDSRLDSRLCPYCRSLDGEIVAISGEFETRGAVYAHPPAHPNCRCTIVPWREDWGSMSQYTDLETWPEGSPMRKRLEKSDSWKKEQASLKEREAKQLERRRQKASPP